MYGFQIERYLRHFDRDQLFIATTDRLRSHPVETMRAIFEFVGVDPGWCPPRLGDSANERGLVRTSSFALRPGEVNPDDERLSETARRDLTRALRDDMKMLRRHLEDDVHARGFDAWGFECDEVG